MTIKTEYSYDDTKHRMTSGQYFNSETAKMLIARSLDKHMITQGQADELNELADVNGDGAF